MAQPQAAPEPAGQTLDPKVVAQLQSLDEGGGQGFFSSLVREFAVEGTRLLGVIQQSAASGNAMALRDSAHSLKGAAASMGAANFAAICREVEMIGRAGFTTGTGELLGKLEEEWARVQSGLKEYLRDA